MYGDSVPEGFTVQKPAVPINDEGMRKDFGDETHFYSDSEKEQLAKDQMALPYYLENGWVIDRFERRYVVIKKG